MSMTDPLVLPADVLLIPLKKVSQQIRDRVDAADDDVAVTRPLSRVPSRLIDADSAHLVRLFTSPCTVTEAVLAYSRATGKDAYETLDGAFPVIQRLIEAGFLVRPSSVEASKIAASFNPGYTTAGCVVNWPLQVTEDTEVYHVSLQSGQAAVLKIARKEATTGFATQIQTEVDILTRLDGRVNAKLITSGVEEGRVFEVIELIDGHEVTQAARACADLESRVELCTRVIEAFSWLHTQGVVHGDIHPRNVLITTSGDVKIIDFGLASVVEDTKKQQHPSTRAGVSFFTEPEACASVLAQSATFLGEQYGVAALVYLMLAGDHYINFSVERAELIRQIMIELPVPLASRGQQPMPAIEKVLARALEKDPAQRYVSLAEFGAAFRAGHGPLNQSAAVARSAKADDYSNEFLARFRLDSPLFKLGLPDAPTGSLSWGSAGVAYSLWRIASVREDPGLLALADAWIHRTKSSIGSPGAYYSATLDITQELVGECTPYHTASGFHAVDALISLARSDSYSAQRALEHYIEAAGLPCTNIDLTLGRCGSLLVSGLLLEAARATCDIKSLESFGDKLSRGISDELAPMPSIPDAPAIHYTGVAHGWAGVLYALLIWSRAVRRRPSSLIRTRLEELSQYVERSKKSARMRWNTDPHRAAGYMPGWCNGSAGFVHLWGLAHDMFHDDKYWTLAEQFALNAYESVHSHENLCCGLAGQAYALNAMYKRSWDRKWLVQSTNLAKIAKLKVKGSSATPETRSESLYKGELGVCLLLEELQSPEFAAMPLFEA